jgi:tetrapyrrole methylase family protein/MazG family protein
MNTAILSREGVQSIINRIACEYAAHCGGDAAWNHGKTYISKKGNRMSIVIVGLGPGGWQQVTLEAKHILETASKVYLRTARHPTVSYLPKQLPIESFDDEVYDIIAQQIVQHAHSEDPVVYAVPGNPLVGEATVTRILALSRAESIPVRIVSGLSFVDSVLPLLGEYALSPGLQIVDAEQPVLDPGRPALICQIFDARIASELKLSLLEDYPPEHVVTLITAAGVEGVQKVVHLPLFRLDRGQEIDHLTCLYVPALPLEQNLRSFATLEEIVAKLRGPGGCPWDKEQTHATLKPHLIEESYEVLDALDSGDSDKLQEELGDLLMQVFLHAQIAAEADAFDIHDVVKGIAAKLIRRHPHVFGDVTVADAAEVLVNWEAIKKTEREEGQSMLAGVPKAMPALAYGQAILKRAARVGLSVKRKDTLAREIERDLRVLLGTKEKGKQERLLGKLLFDLGNLARALKVDPEESLRLANEQFRRQFASMERISQERGIELRVLSAAERAKLWQEAGACVAPLETGAGGQEVGDRRIEGDEGPS